MNSRFTLANSIYPRHCLEETQEAFAHLCSVKILQESPRACEIEIEAVTDEVALSRITPEFLNYLLDLSAAYHLGLMKGQYGTNEV